MYHDPNQPQQPSQGGQQPGQPSPGDPTVYGLPPVDPPYYEQPSTQPTYPPPYGQQPYGQPPAYGIPPVPGYAAPPPQKKSLRWLWITLGIVGGLVVLSCVGCSILWASVIGPSFNKGFQSSLVANNYYQAIKNQNYALAYTYLDTTNVSVQNQQVTQDLFTTLAQAADTTKGPVTAYKYVTLTTDNSDPNSATVTMSVTRGGQTYDVHLKLHQVGGTWKITDADNI